MLNLDAYGICAKIKELKNYNQTRQISTKNRIMALKDVQSRDVSLLDKFRVFSRESILSGYKNFNFSYAALCGTLRSMTFKSVYIEFSNLIKLFSGK